MKINKMFCIDEELFKKLDGINASELVNRLLIEHFQDNDKQNLIFLKKKMEENKLILKESRKKDKELKRLIEKTKQKEQTAIKQISLHERWLRSRQLKGGV